MAGFKFAGANSSMVLSGLTKGVHSISINPTADKLETTTFDDAADDELWETSMAGMRRGGVLTVGVRYDSTNTLKLGDTGTVTITLESGKTISFDAWVQNQPYNIDVAGLIEQPAVSLQITGPVTFPS
jgi:hypothetical protein